MGNCPFCLSTRSTIDDDKRLCEGCGAEFHLEDELRDVRDELERARDELRLKELAPGQGRVVDEDRFLVDCLRVQNRIDKLEEEERTLLAHLEAE